MKYYLDEDLSQVAAALLPQAKVDAASIHEVGAEGWSEAQLDHAGCAGRCLATRNRNDFIALNVQFFHDQRQHGGILIVPLSYPGDNFALLAQALATYANTHPTGLWTYAIDFLPAPPLQKSARQRARR